LDNIRFPGLINGRFASGDLSGWTIDTASGGSAFTIELVETDDVIASIDIDPDTLNLKSRRKWVSAYIELPEIYDAYDIDPETVAISEVGAEQVSIPAEPSPVKIGDHDDDGVADLMVKLACSALQSHAQSPEAEITVIGALYDGTAFTGTDTIKVLE
jgi:hypothetical protein